MRGWLQRDDVRHSVKLTMVFVVVLAVHMIVGVACVLLLSQGGAIPASARSPAYIWILVLGLILAGMGTYAVHRALSER